jgi:hypothetical protein
MVRVTLLLSLLGASLSAQPLRVFSEFVHVGPDGEPSLPASPREILSPALARNSFATYQIVVKAGSGASSYLYVGQNPENILQVTLYREKSGVLTQVSQPVEIQGTEIIWMDVWVPREAPAVRMKLEPELYMNQDWVIYPMEVRVAEVVVPDGPRPYGIANPMDVMRSFTCGTKLASGEAAGPITRASLSYRNALEDVALAPHAPRNEVQKVVGPCDQPAPSNPESYLRTRDYLLRLR